MSNAKTKPDYGTLYFCILNKILHKNKLQKILMFLNLQFVVGLNLMKLRNVTAHYTRLLNQFFIKL